MVQAFAVLSTFISSLPRPHPAAMAMPKACIMLFGGAFSSCEDLGLKKFARKIKSEAAPASPWLNQLLEVMNEDGAPGGEEPRPAVAAVDRAVESEAKKREQQKKRKQNTSVEAVELAAQRSEAELRRVRADRGRRRLQERDAKAAEAKKQQEAGNSEIYFVGPCDLLQNWYSEKQPLKKDVAWNLAAGWSEEWAIHEAKSTSTQRWAAPGSRPPLSGRSWSCRATPPKTVLTVGTDEHYWGGSGRIQQHCGLLSAMVISFDGCHAKEYGHPGCFKKRGCESSDPQYVGTPSPLTKSFDFERFDSSRLLILKGGNSHVRIILWGVSRKVGLEDS